MEAILQQGMALLAAQGGGAISGKGQKRELGPDEEAECLARGKEAQDREEKDHITNTGKKRAVLIGINYEGQKGELNGCINDVKNLTELLTDVYQWDPSDIKTYTDHTDEKPTRDNIMSAISWLIDGAAEGDSLWFSYSGHGGQKVDPEGLEEDGMNETLLPIDFREAGMIPDTELNAALVKPLPDGCRLTVVIDACHSGSGLDLSFQWTGDGWREEMNPDHVEADVMMLSGCQDFDTSADASFNGCAAGALTTALLNVLKENKGMVYNELIPSVHGFMEEKGFKQRPVLTSSQAFNFGREFNLDDIMYNKNEKLGRIERKKFDPKPNPQQTNFLMSLLQDQEKIKGAMGILQQLGCCCCSFFSK